MLVYGNDVVEGYALLCVIDQSDPKLKIFLSFFGQLGGSIVMGSMFGSSYSVDEVSS
jgi:hypothetical protein